jgi:hypothetical protein
MSLSPASQDKFSVDVNGAHGKFHDRSFGGLDKLT